MVLGRQSHRSNGDNEGDEELGDGLEKDSAVYVCEEMEVVLS